MTTSSVFNKPQPPDQSQPKTPEQLEQLATQIHEALTQFNKLTPNEIATVSQILTEKTKS